MKRFAFFLALLLLHGADVTEQPASRCSIQLLLPQLLVVLLLLIFLYQSFYLGFLLSFELASRAQVVQVLQLFFQQLLLFTRLQ